MEKELTTKEKCIAFAKFVNNYVNPDNLEDVWIAWEQKKKEDSLSVNSDEYEFGKNEYYFKGQVVVWGGHNSAIIRIDSVVVDAFSNKCYKSTTKNYNSLSVDWLRPATEEEIEILGDKEIIYIKD